MGYIGLFLAYLDFSYFEIMKLGAHLGELIFQVTTKSVILVSSLDLTSKLYIKLHIYSVQYCPDV